MNILVTRFQSIDGLIIQPRKIYQDKNKANVQHYDTKYTNN